MCTTSKSKAERKDETHRNNIPWIRFESRIAVTATASSSGRSCRSGNSTPEEFALPLSPEAEKHLDDYYDARRERGLLYAKRFSPKEVEFVNNQERTERIRVDRAQAEEADLSDEAMDVVEEETSLHQLFFAAPVKTQEQIIKSWLNNYTANLSDGEKVVIAGQSKRTVWWKFPLARANAEGDDLYSAFKRRLPISKLKDLISELFGSIQVGV